MAAAEHHTVREKEGGDQEQSPADDENERQGVRARVLRSWGSPGQSLSATVIRGRYHVVTIGVQNMKVRVSVVEGSDGRVGGRHEVNTFVLIFLPRHSLPIGFGSLGLPKFPVRTLCGERLVTGFGRLDLVFANNLRDAAPHGTTSFRRGVRLV